MSSISRTDGPALVKTSDSTFTVNFPVQEDTVLNKSQEMKFGTPQQRHNNVINLGNKRPFLSQLLLQVRQRKRMTRQGPMVENLGEKPIRRRKEQLRSRDHSNKSNLSIEVTRIEVPGKNTYMQSSNKSSHPRNNSAQNPQTDYSTSLREDDAK